MKPYIIVLSLLLIQLSSYSISGSFSDDFEEYEENSKPNASNSFFSWGQSSYSKISKQKSYSGSTSLRFLFEGSVDKGEDSWSEQRFSLNEIKSELWIRYKLWIPENYFHRNAVGPDNNKGLLLLWNGTYSGLSHTSLHFARPVDIGASGESQSNPGGSILYAAWKPNSGTAWNFHDQNNLTSDARKHSNTTQAIIGEDRGQWVDWVIQVRASTLPIAPNNIEGDGNGIVRVWKNNEMIFNIWNANNHYNGEGLNGWDQGYLLGWANSGFDEDTYFYLDDFAIGETSDDINFNVIAPTFDNVTKTLN